MRVVSGLVGPVRFEQAVARLNLRMRMRVGRK